MKLCKECLASLDAEIASLSADLTVLEKLRNQYQKERDELRIRDESDGMAPASKVTVPLESGISITYRSCPGGCGMPFTDGECPHCHYGSATWKLEIK
jgi:hypothetical protein